MSIANDMRRAAQMLLNYADDMLTRDHGFDDSGDAATTARNASLMLSHAAEVEAMEQELRSLRLGLVALVRDSHGDGAIVYDLSQAQIAESAVTAKLVMLGWTPPQ